MGEDKDKNLRLEIQYFKAFWVKKSLPRNINCVFKERKSIVSKGYVLCSCIMKIVGSNQDDRNYFL